jgi:hypothetical protein
MCLFLSQSREASFVVSPKTPIGYFAMLSISRRACRPHFGKFWHEFAHTIGSDGSDRMDRIGLSD